MGSSTGRKAARVVAALLAAFFVCSTGAPPRLDQVYRTAHAAYDRGDYLAARSTLDAALAVAGDRSDEIVWRLRILRALTLITFGDYGKVLSAASPELPPALRRSDIAVDRLRALAIASYQGANYDAAQRYIDQARKLAAEAHRGLLPQVLLTRANMRQVFGALTREHDARQALRGATRSRDLRLQTQCLGTLGNIAASQERFDEAVDFGEKTLRLASSLNNASLVHRTEGNLGWYYNELGDRLSAEEHLRNAVAIAAELHADDNRIVYLLQLGQTELSRGDLGAARRDFTTARDEAEKLKSKQLGNALLSVAQVAFESGDVGAAREANGSALLFNEKAGETIGIQRSRILEARIALADRQLDVARDVLERVVADAQAKSVRWEAQSWLAQVYAARNESVRAEEHFRRAAETVEDARRDVQNSELRISVPELATSLYDAYIEFLVRQGRRVDALRVADMNRARTLAEGLDIDRNGSFDPERLVREANIVALSYRLGRARSFLWVVSPAGVELFFLPPAKTIEEAVARYQETFATARGTIEASGAAGEELYRMLVAPAAQVLRGVSRLAIISDGRLAAFNFETLVVPTVRRYWIEDVTIESAPSLQLLTRSRPSDKRGRLLLIGNAAPPDRAFAPLTYAPVEMQRVRTHFRESTQLAGAQATPRAYLATAGESYAFVHFVAHAAATRQRPLDSAIILASDGTGYKLYARDIVAHRLAARLVTISSCAGAGRRTYAGEGLVGLAWAFLRAGAHEVIAALWEVNDRATSELMDSMYSAIDAGRSPADALRIAKLKLLRSKTVYRKPFYWAPFVVYSGS